MTKVQKLTLEMSEKRERLNLTNTGGPQLARDGAPGYTGRLVVVMTGWAAQLRCLAWPRLTGNPSGLEPCGVGGGSTGLASAGSAIVGFEYGSNSAALRNPRGCSQCAYGRGSA